MQTSMLDALANEADEVLRKSVGSLRLTFDVYDRVAAIRKQIGTLAEEERSSGPSISADASDEEFATFIADHFPHVMLSENFVGDALEEHSRTLDALTGRSDAALNLYAWTDMSVEEIARVMAVHFSVIATYVRFARQRGDNRAAKGDLKRPTQVA